MRLSEAMMLGAATCKMEPNNINSCAIGAALNAVGVPLTMPGEFTERYSQALKLWKWLNSRALLDIAIKFDVKVCEGQWTLEQLVDYVRSIEPEEVETEPTQEPVQLELPFPAEVAQ